MFATGEVTARHNSAEIPPRNVLVQSDRGAPCLKEGARERRREGRGEAGQDWISVMQGNVS